MFPANRLLESNAIECNLRCCKKGFCDNKTPEGGTSARPPGGAGCLENLVKFPPIPRPFWARGEGEPRPTSAVPGDSVIPRCVICMDRRPEVVLVPCGHQGGNSIGLLWPQKRPQFWPKKSPEVSFEKGCMHKLPILIISINFSGHFYYCTGLKDVLGSKVTGTRATKLLSCSVCSVPHGTFDPGISSL